MKSNGDSSEAMIITWCLLIGALCIVGSVATDTGPVEFFFIGLAWLIGLCILGGLLVGMLVVVVRLVSVCRTMEKRELKEILKQEYSWNTIQEGYKTVYDHAKQYAAEVRRSDLPFIEKFSRLDDTMMNIIRDITRKGK